MKFHPVAELFPLMSDEEFAGLCADIEANGLRSEIWTYEGKIIDGRNRFNACTKAGVEPRYREWNGAGSLVSFVVSLNLNRRHLSESQRAMVAQKMAQMMASQEETPHQTAAAFERWARDRELSELWADENLSFDEKTAVANYLKQGWSSKRRSTGSMKAKRCLYVASDRDRMKIGVSSSPEHRIQSLKTACPNIVLHAHWPGGFAEESELHELLVPYSVGGEWFSISDESIAVVEKFMQNRQLAGEHVSANLVAAQLLNVSVRSIERAAKVQKDGVPELAEKVESGEISVSQAARIATLPKGKQKRLIGKGRRAAKKLLTALKTTSLKKSIGTGCIVCDPNAEISREVLSATFQKLAFKYKAQARFFLDVIEELEGEELSDEIKGAETRILEAIDLGYQTPDAILSSTRLDREHFDAAIASLLDYEMIEAAKEIKKTDQARGATKTIYQRKAKAPAKELEYEMEEEFS